MPDVDPYDPVEEHRFKNAHPLADAKLADALAYWREYYDRYGTPQGASVRSLMRTALAAAQRIDELQTERDVAVSMRMSLEAIAAKRKDELESLGARLREVQQRNVILLSKIQEWEAREQ